MPVTPGAQYRSTTTEGGTEAGALAATTVGYGPYLSPGAPAAGFLNGVAQKGALVINTATGVLYANTGTLAATTYTVVGAQV